MPPPPHHPIKNNNKQPTKQTNNETLQNIKQNNKTTQNKDKQTKYKESQCLGLHERSYFSFQPVLHRNVRKAVVCPILSVGWCI